MSNQPNFLGRLCGVSQIPPSAPDFAFGQKGVTRPSTDQAFKEISLKVIDVLRAALGANSEAAPPCILKLWKRRQPLFPTRRKTV